MCVRQTGRHLKRCSRNLTHRLCRAQATGENRQATSGLSMLHIQWADYTRLQMLRQIVRVCTGACLCVYMCMPVCLHARACVSARVHACVHICPCMCARGHARVCVCARHRPTWHATASPRSGRSSTVSIRDTRLRGGRLGALISNGGTCCTNMPPRPAPPHPATVTVTTARAA